MINEKIKELRQRAGLSQKALADKLQVAQTTIAGYETGRNEPGVDMLIRLSAALDVSIDTLVSNPHRPDIDTDADILQDISGLSERDKHVIRRMIAALHDEANASRRA